MTVDRMLELLNIEHQCMLRGSHGDCDRNCADCELVQDDGELHEMYTDVIGIVEKEKPKKPDEIKPYSEERPEILFGWCPTCHKATFSTYERCPSCGQVTDWNP